MDEFDVCGPLPEPGTTLLEASAGTGKTWTIAALVARYVAEGVRTLDEMLVVTFGRAASQELRSRVRERLVQVEHLLADPAGASPHDDVLLAHLLDTDAEGRDRRLARVRAALAAFDSAAIVTIHQFCHTVLRGLGVAGDTDPSARLVEDVDELLEEVVDDLYLQMAIGPAAARASELSRAEALRIAREAALVNRLSRLEPADADVGSRAGLRRLFAQKVREEFDRRKRVGALLSYDDLLAQLAGALDSADSPARKRMRERWRLVLVDEFQDTDPTQWQVFRRAFHDPDPPSADTAADQPTLVLIGDPKQAIYAFRGGDVVTYLQAKQVAGRAQTLSRNFRTDRAVLDAVNVLLGGAELGDPGIMVPQARSARAGGRLSGPHSQPFRMRALTRSLVDGDLNAPIRVGAARSRVAEDLAADVHRLLVGAGTTFDGRPLQARDVAVLAHTHRQLDLVRRALAALQVPAVVGANGSVFHTSAATDWLTLLQALEQPHRSERVRAAALGPFLGHDLSTLAAGGEELTESLATTVRDWLDLFRGRGVAAVFQAAEDAGIAARLLGRVGGERDLTDLRHLAEILHREAVAGRSGVVALTSWLREQMREDRTDVTDERARRLDSDALAVQLVTIHSSKGLEYPVVYLPFGFDRYVPETRHDLIAYHDDQGCRVLDVGGAETRPPEIDERERGEDLGERLRLLYVAMTRAQAQLVVWWAPTTNTSTSELHRLLFGRTPGEAKVPSRAALPDDREAVTRLRSWEQRHAFVLEKADPAPVSGRLPVTGETELQARRWTRSIDQRWRRTSYTALSTPAQEDNAAGVSSEPDVLLKNDEPSGPLAEDDDTTTAAEPVEPPADAVPSPMADLPAGAQFGSLVHAVLEHADPDAPDHGGDLRAELRAQVEEQWVAWPQDIDREQLTEALLAVNQTSLGPAAGRLRLCDIPARDRLCELEFELPLSGGDTARPRDRGSARGPQLRDLAPLLRGHLPDADPVRVWADALADPVLGEQDLRGYLTGSIDVVLRVGERDSPRFLVVDYKTNWLGRGEEQLTSEHYTPERLDEAMGHSGYPLQALLYAVVLHRFLRWRLPGYEPGRHLGGVLYLYVRGMCGPQTPERDGRPCGVFSWQPPAELVLAVSDLLDGRAGDQPGGAA